MGFVAETGPAKSDSVDDGSPAAATPASSDTEQAEPADTNKASEEARVQPTSKQTIVSEDENDIMIEIGDDSFVVDVASGIAFRVLVDSDDMPEVGTWDGSLRQIVFEADGGSAAVSAVADAGTLDPELAEPDSTALHANDFEEAMPPAKTVIDRAETEAGSQDTGDVGAAYGNIFSVLHDYDPQGQEGCIPLAVGQRVVVTDWSHAEWWIGHLESDPSVSGAFPVGFVAETGPAEGIPPTQEVQAAEQAVFVCAYDYDPQGSAGCLHLAVGDRVLVDEPDDALEWWTGQLESDPNVQGAFPAGFVVPAAAGAGTT